MIEHLHRIAAHAWHVGEHDAGRRACERLARMRLPDRLRPIIRRNRTWYTIEVKDYWGGEFTRINVRPAREGWSLFNPTIVRYGDRLLVNVRSSNYRIVNGQYVMPEADAGVIRTENILLALGESLCAHWGAAYEKTDCPVDGYEDIRLNVIDRSLFFSATTRNMAPHDSTARIAVGHLGVRPALAVPACCPETANGAHEKNWMPILGRARFIYACSVNGRTATVELQDDAWHVTHHAEAPPIASEFRGGSQLVPIRDGRWLAIIHEVVEDAGRRIYEHRFVRFSEPDDWRIEAVSEPFAFREPRAIEFCAGLAIDGEPGMEELVATFGVRDEEAWMVRLDMAAVLETLEDAWA
jgi:predicted GH43/DUF377 family glycosyl hydrolase